MGIERITADRGSLANSFAVDTALGSDIKLAPYQDTDGTIITDDIATLSAVHHQTDANGIIVGEWCTGLFSYHTVYMWIISTFVPCVSVGQIAHRVGLAHYTTCVLLVGLFYLATVGCSLFEHTTLNVIAIVCSLIFVSVVTALRVRVRQLFQIPGFVAMDLCTVMWCGCCAIAQMSAHVSSAKPGVCSLVPRDVLPGYK
ncbi:hypothetical protein LEN26_006195 [Aphanomyces euteiches]|nr:hypothetical protein AeMF1_021250 [Aphanomyces euteiches]KAH9136462.1 hypothetical protein LEN26_006195 [Aphanomyces euteiches]KAH9181009.1 hypothetical protein AeNC1_017015 [Aphanomyces euteiches]